jgi:hypothetical protein
MTMPSESPVWRPRLYVRIAWDTAEVGVYSSPCAIHDFHPVGRQHLKRAGQSRHGGCMRVHAEKQRAIDLLPLPGQTNGLTDGEDMPFIESPIKCGTAMS